ncbi:Malate/lactate/ureidoglycolate dehydrogenase, LDH2 family [Paracoccus alcaliphilus]|uniref:Malate/lactate/ureidoglycolate dehydrogenase, LDH2 family n=1 Tax=Paracoccus alcaliphilus TaxID=34002 RepID=A0A1H8ELZ9_9RHOB|nr:Ldh family oxidoreductase [Paracoccus alcaliphilus]WCR20812.1 Ldh family oxidoreductase [Paracoccus alcaliphilus]SEN20410.1 Malate/lactate/ureidoglycolate dehydrogenase, LDH2 family [Paracoccus alcaliphilus]
MTRKDGVFTEAQLAELVAAIFRGHDVPPQDARRVAECLVLADLRGVSSHGVSRVPIYAERLRRGLVKARPDMRLEQVLTVAARLDADDALGFVAATKAMDCATAMAREHGMGMTFVRRSTHFGMAANYLLQATDAGLAAFVFTNASRAMPIWGGREPFLGTSPFAFAAPCGDQPVVLDMALSVVARGKVRRAAARGEAIPEGWALDAEGNPTTDARKGYEGVVLPLAGAKGSGLALMMEIVAGVMSGAAFGGAVGNQYNDFDAPQDVGHCFIAFRPDLFDGPEEYRTRMEALRHRAKDQPRAAGVAEILLPGEIEARTTQARRRDGIRIDPEDLAALRAEAERVGAAFPA